MKSKKEQVIELVKNNQIFKAMAIAKNFTREFSNEELRSIQIAYESQQIQKKNFYTSLGIDVYDHTSNAKNLMLKYAQ